MAVQQNKKSPSKRGMHRAHDFLNNPPLAMSRRPVKCICDTTSALPAITVERRSPRVQASKVPGLGRQFPVVGVCLPFLLPLKE